LIFSSAATDAISPTLTVAEPSRGNCAKRRIAVCDLSDTALTDQIIALGGLHLAAEARYEVTNCFSDKGEADMWRIAMREAQARLAGTVHG
jgi:hypothetical protein